MKHVLIIIMAVLHYNTFAQTAAEINDTLFNQVDKKGLKQGHWKKYYNNGKLKYRGFFKDDKPVGELKRYFESGNLKALMNFNISGDYSEIKMFYENGTLAANGYYYGSKKDSLWRYYSYYDKTLLSDEFYIKGVKNGLSRKYYTNGNITEKIEWKNDIKNGIWEQYYQDNSLRLKGMYKNGKLTGDYLVYYPNGHIQVAGHFHEDERHGKWLYYDKDDSVKLELNYHYDKLLNEDELTGKQQEFFRHTDRNMNKFNEPRLRDFYRSDTDEY